MKNFHPFFSIGTVGMIVIGLLHMFMAWALSIASAHGTFFTLYPMFLAFLIVGVALTISREKAARAAK